MFLVVFVCFQAKNLIAEQSFVDELDLFSWETAIKSQRCFSFCVLCHYNDIHYWFIIISKALSCAYTLLIFANRLVSCSISLSSSNTARSMNFCLSFHIFGLIFTVIGCMIVHLWWLPSQRYLDTCLSRLLKTQAGLSFHRTKLAWESLNSSIQTHHGYRHT